MTRDEVRARIDTIEESYEFFLAFAAQGVRNDRESPSGSQLRDYLTRTANALRELGSGFAGLVAAGEVPPAEAAARMAQVLERDAEAALAGVELVLGQERVSSQLIDNLNASIHLRALLTDLFLIDEILAKAPESETSPSPSS